LIRRISKLVDSGAVANALVAAMAARAQGLERPKPECAFVTMVLNHVVSHSGRHHHTTLEVDCAHRMPVQLCTTALAPPFELVPIAPTTATRPT
jgi:hypothetical protein